MLVERKCDVGLESEACAFQDDLWGEFIAHATDYNEMLSRWVLFYGMIFYIKRDKR
jgi:hypothetical protein